MADLLTDLQFDQFRKLIYDASGITFSDTNRSILDSRLKERLREKKLTNVEDYYKIITSDQGEFKVFLDSITTNLTRFFRNQPHFDAFVNYVIPHVVENKKAAGGDRTIRIWSAGCSTGEEPYTIAMIMKEICPMGFNFQITASDISMKCLMTAQKGFYADAKVDGIPANYLSKYFTKVDGGYQMKKEIMDTIRFDYHNLRNDSGARNLDVIFCRNVLIYFDEEAQLAVINRFWNSMAAKGFLFIGHSESLFGMNTKFEFLKTEWACFYGKNANK